MNKQQQIIEQFRALDNAIAIAYQFSTQYMKLFNSHTGIVFINAATVGGDHFFFNLDTKPTIAVFKEFCQLMCQHYRAEAGSLEKQRDELADLHPGVYKAYCQPNTVAVDAK